MNKINTEDILVKKNTRITNDDYKEIIKSELANELKSNQDLKKMHDLLKLKLKL